MRTWGPRCEMMCQRLLRGRVVFWCPSTPKRPVSHQLLWWTLHYSSELNAFLVSTHVTLVSLYERGWLLCVTEFPWCPSCRAALEEAVYLPSFRQTEYENLLRVGKWELPVQKRLELVVLHQRGELHPPDIQQGAHGAKTQICRHLADTTPGSAYNLHWSRTTRVLLFFP